MQQPRSALTLPAADQSEEETEASLGAGTQLLRVQVRMREMNSIILRLQEQMIIARDFTDSLTLRLKKAELVIEEKFQTTVGVAETHAQRITALEDTYKVWKTFSGQTNPLGAPAASSAPSMWDKQPQLASPTPSERRHNQTADPSNNLTKVYDMAAQHWSPFNLAQSQ